MEPDIAWESPTPPAFDTPVGGGPRWNIAITFSMEKLECGYPMVIKILKTCLFVSTEYTNVTDGWTDRWALHDGIGRVCKNAYALRVYTLSLNSMKTPHRQCVETTNLAMPGCPCWPWNNKIVVAITVWKGEVCCEWHYLFSYEQTNAPCKSAAVQHWTAAAMPSRVAADTIRPPAQDIWGTPKQLDILPIAMPSLHQARLVGQYNGLHCMCCAYINQEHTGSCAGLLLIRTPIPDGNLSCCWQLVSNKQNLSCTWMSL